MRKLLTSLILSFIIIIINLVLWCLVSADKDKQHDQPIEVDVMFSLNDTILFRVQGFPTQWFYTPVHRKTFIMSQSLSDSINRSPCPISDRLCKSKVIGFSLCNTIKDVIIITIKVNVDNR